MRKKPEGFFVLHVLALELPQLSMYNREEKKKKNE